MTVLLLLLIGLLHYSTSLLCTLVLSIGCSIISMYNLVSSGGSALMKVSELCLVLS